MAVLTVLPHKSIVDGFKGVLDFYLWKGIACVRRWPRKPKMPRSPAVQASAAQFGLIATALSATPANIRSRATTLASGTTWTWRDLRYRAIYGNLVS